MSPQNEDFLFAQEAQRRGYVSEDQVDEAFRLQTRMQEDLKIDERIGVILVKRGWLGEEQARRVQARLEPDTEKDEIEGYRFIEKIGHGAMGTVYKAVHLGLHRPVAVKILRRDLARDQIQVERLKEEAKLLASLDHPNIVRALDAGESRGFPFVVMEYVEGETLKDRISRDGPMHEIDALRIARGIADALERARRMGVVHRDVKPGNIICAVKDDEPKLMDLGLAKGPVDLGLTQHGATVGTPQYISPEQAQDPRRADIRSDIYSLGATLYALVTGRPPFQGTTLAEILTKVLYEAPPPPRMLNKKVSPEVGYLIERMMLKDPALRYRTPADVVHDIDEILAGRSIIPEGFTGNWEAYLLRQKIRKWVKIASTAAVIVVLLTAGTVFVTRHIEWENARERGRAEIAAALFDLQPLRSDTYVEVQGKWLKAKALRDTWEGYEPDRYDQLVDMVDQLKGETGWFENLGAVGGDIDALIGRRSFGKAVERLDRLIGQIPGRADSPAAAAIQSLKSDVIVKSDRRLEDLWNEQFGEPARTVDELIERHETYLDAIQAGLYPSQAVRDARDTASKAVAALRSIQSDLGTLDDRSSPATLLGELRELDFKFITDEYDEGRRDVADRAGRAWQPLDNEGWLPWKGRVGPLVETRLRALDKRLAAQFEWRAAVVQENAQNAFDEGRSLAALKALQDLQKAASAAGLMGIRGQALSLRRILQARFDRAEELAEARFQEFEEEVLARLKAGDVQGMEDVVEHTLAQVGARWPYRVQVEATLQLAQAQRNLYDTAYDELFARMERGDEIRSVVLRSGPPDRKWVLKPGGDRASWTLMIAPMVTQEARERSLTEVAPEQLAEWARQGVLPLPPLVRAVVALGSLPETEDDLRPLLKYLAAAYTALDEAGYRGGLAERVKEQFGAASSDQRARERTARGAFQGAEFYFNVEKNYDLAIFHLWQLLDPISLLRHTNFFEEQETRIQSLYREVNKHVANAKLAKQFPGARLTLDGEVTRMEFDFDDAIQLMTFRRAEAHATGVREPYNNPRQVLTPRGNRQNFRFHLLRGMEGLVQHHPLALPCIFDPAEAIRVQFTLHTLDSPFFLVVDIDGLQVGILSADPGGLTYRGRWVLPEDVPLIKSDKTRPTVGFYGRGRGVAFHAGRGLHDPRSWRWPSLGRGRNYERWAPERRSAKMEIKKRRELFCFEQSEVYRVAVVREQGRITLFVNGEEIASDGSDEWARIGRTSDRDRNIRNKGTGLLQILTWTPQAIDNLVVEGIVLDHYRAR